MKSLSMVVLLLATLIVVKISLIGQPVDHAQYVLTSGTDYTHIGPGHPVGCPQCKDLFYGTQPLSSPPGTIITSIQVSDRTPKSNNHWYRCQVEVDCSVAEFSDVNEHNKSCVGTRSCIVWRATDGRVGSEQDVIDVRWRRQ